MTNKTVFVRTEKAPKQELRGQAAVVLEAIEAREDGGTIEQLGHDVTGTLVTRQDPERVVAYYLCIFKKQGLVRATKPEVEVETVTETEVETEIELEDALTD